MSNQANEEINDEIEEIEEILHDEKRFKFSSIKIFLICFFIIAKTFMGKVKHWMVANLQKYAFITVLLCASVIFISKIIFQLFFKKDSKPFI